MTPDQKLESDKKAIESLLVTRKSLDDRLARQMCRLDQF